MMQGLAEVDFHNDTWVTLSFAINLSFPTPEEWVPCRIKVYKGFGKSLDIVKHLNMKKIK